MPILAANWSGSRRIVLKVGAPPVLNITCYGFHIWAGDFLAAEKLYAQSARIGSLVAHFLCCQSIELSLKSFLSLRGLSRTLRHAALRQ